MPLQRMHTSCTYQRTWLPNVADTRPESIRILARVNASGNRGTDSCTVRRLRAASTARCRTFHYMLQACTRWRCHERQTTQVGPGRYCCKGTVPGTGLAWFAGLAACALAPVGVHGPPRERFSATQALQRSLLPAVIRASFRWASVLHDHRRRQQHGPKAGMHGLMGVAVHR